MDLLTLSLRKEVILRTLVSEYISNANPVGSATIARKYNLGVSPATIRNEMAELEEEGYITHPHTSAGRIPSDKGYRYYVECLMEETELPLAEKRTIRHQFHQAALEIEQWSRLAAAILAHCVENAAMVTQPKATPCHFKRVELVSLQEFLILLIIVLQEAKFKQQMLTLEEAVPQEELTRIANRMSAEFNGLTTWDIGRHAPGASFLEEQVQRTVTNLMAMEDQETFEDMYIDGLRNLFSQPEFAHSGRLLELLRLFEERRTFRNILSYALSGEGVQIVIGGENPEDTMKEFSVVLTQYGTANKARGVLAVMGPTRMRYARAISSVRYLSSLMNELLEGVYR
ncbi:MAG: heat-inducible transcription repressor HrcA [Chloroflexi bacterium]|nr:heat-inducible transcription repressor HrcA [Chloroflexota bacterium]